MPGARAQTADPLQELQRLKEERERLDALERARAAEALRQGASFGAVARALGISRQAAHRRYKDLAPHHVPLGISSQARRALLLARREAVETGRTTVGSEHLLLGVLRSGGPTSRALEAEGITADGARECLRGATEDAGSARAALAEAEQIARARHAACVEPEHVVLAALNAVDGGAQRAITALGVPAAAVRERLGC